MRLLCASVALLALCGCGKPEPIPVPSMRASALDPAAAADADVSGIIGGARFTLRDAWFRVTNRAGFQRVDLMLSAGELGERCKDADVTAARHVWLRFNGVTSVAPGTYRGDVDTEDDLSAHYEEHGEEGWTGRGGTAAVLIDPPPPPVAPGKGPAGPDVISGKVKACFGPGDQGCVAGTFSARRCLTDAELEGPFSNKPAQAADAAPTNRPRKQP